MYIEYPLICRNHKSSHFIAIWFSKWAALKCTFKMSTAIFFQLYQTAASLSEQLNQSKMHLFYSFAWKCILSKYLIWKCTFPNSSFENVPIGKPRLKMYLLNWSALNCILFKYCIWKCTNSNRSFENDTILQYAIVKSTVICIGQFTICIKSIAFQITDYNLLILIMPRFFWNNHCEIQWVSCQLDWDGEARVDSMLRMTAWGHTRV